ncbi:hypothetical protein VPH35_137549 [Triticum aestivum]
MPPKAPKAPITCNWVRSNVTDNTLDDFVKTGYLPKKEVMSYRAPDPSEERPQPRDGEVVIFADHMSRGFAPPGSKFFKDVLHFFDLRPQDIGPNSVSNICNFQVFCEVYLGEEPSLQLFRELFYLNRQNECADGPSLELGGISIQQRRDCLFPYAEPPSHPKDWNQTWFYCQDTSPANENPLPGFRALRLESNHPLPEKLSQAERQPLIPTINKIKALLGNGLNGVDLVRVWIAWWVIPLSRRPGLMCDYTGRKDDPLRHSPNDLPEDVVDDMTKSLLNESLADCGRTGLSPFCKANPAPAANDKFWKVSAEAKLSKRAKKSNPVEEPVLTEPNASAFEPPSAPAPKTTAPTKEQAMEGSDNPEIPSPAQPADDPDVVITRTEFVEPGRPTVLAKCSAKEELLERRRARLDITNYANLSIGDIVASYIGQVHNSRDLEFDMVKQIQQKSEMVSAIFGPRSSNLNQNMLTKLKAVYTLVEQLYTGSQRALAVVALSNEVPTHLADVLRRLAVLPQRFQELRWASARAGAIAALSRAKEFLPELDPADIALGYPSLKEDGTPFDQKDFAACVKSVRLVATLIGNDTDLTKY